MQRRHHAEELLQWKQRLDQEEAEVRRIEKEALAVWNKQKHQAKEIIDGQKAESPSPSHYQSSEPRPDSEKGEATESSLIRVLLFVFLNGCLWKLCFFEKVQSQSRQINIY